MDNGNNGGERRPGDAMRPPNAGGMGGGAMRGGRPEAGAMRAGGGMRGPAADSGAAGAADGGGGRAGLRADTGGGQPSRRMCATMDVHRRLLTDDPAYRSARAAIQNATRERTGRPGGARSSGGVARIPVVVHVVYNTPEQKLSMAQIRSQIDVLNRDFRATNPDVSAVPSAFGKLVADARIEFYLAETNPDGKDTEGVTWTETSRSSFGTDDAIKSKATGGQDPWPADRYLNIWTAPQLTSPSGNVLGYAQFPGGPAATDGVVILHSAFGTIGTAAPPFHLGRTTTHEVGHYLNLLHIWGDDGVGCGGTDEVDDTPNQSGPNYGTPTFPKLSCDNAPNGDLYVNYMDYVDDAAMVMFTHGQAARMDACLDTVRAALIVERSRPVPAGPVVSSSSDRIDAFVLGTDRALYHKWWDGSSWGPSIGGYEYMGGVCASPPEVAAWGRNRLDAFVLGTDRALYHKWWDGASWGPSLTGYEYMGGVCMSPPRVASWGPERLDVFVLGTDSAVYHKWWDGASWGPSLTDYEYMGGVCSSPPEVVAWGRNRLDLFVLGTDRALYHKWWDGSAWGPSLIDYEYMGGVCASPPSAVSWGRGRLDVFVLGTDHALYHKWWDGSSWGPSVTEWEYMGGTFTGQPRVTARAENRLDVFVTGTDGALYHKWWDGTAWRPAIDGYESLGGVISDFRSAAPDDISSLSQLTGPGRR